MVLQEQWRFEVRSQLLQPFVTSLSQLPPTNDVDEISFRSRPATLHPVAGQQAHRRLRIIGISSALTRRTWFARLWSSRSESDTRTDLNSRSTASSCMWWAQVYFDKGDRGTLRFCSPRRRGSRLIHITLQFHISSCLRLAIEAHVEEILREAGQPLSSSEIAKFSSLNPDKLGSLFPYCSFAREDYWIKSW